MIIFGLNNPWFRLYLKEILEDIIKYLCMLIFDAASFIIEKIIGNGETVPQ